MQRPPIHSRTPRLALWWLALVLVVAPLLGRMHQVVHAPGLGGAAVHAHAHDHGHHGHASDVAHDVGQPIDTPHALFASHAGADCQLLDQQLLGGALLAGLPVAVHALPAHRPVVQPAAHLSGQRLQAFLARAPPQRA